MTQALVTVGMPVFNGERWLSESITSLLEQTYTDFVLCVSDNASTDNTRAICEHFARQDRRIQYRRNDSNIGLFANYDRVFRLSSSKYFKWAASADVCGREFLDRCIQVLEERADVVLVYPRTALFDESLATAEPYEDNLNLQDERPLERFAQLLTRIRLNNAMNGVIRSDALRKTALNKPYAASDTAMVAALSLAGKFVEVPQRLFFRRVNKATATIAKTRAENRAFFSREPGDIYALHTWKFEIALWKAVSGSDLGVREKIRAISFLVRRLRHNRKKLSAEILSSVQGRMFREVGHE